jgi:hypothetical protein
VEFKEEDPQGRENGRAIFNITASGQRAAAEVEMHYANRDESRYEATGEVPAFADLHSITFKLPPSEACELKVWAHSIKPDGSSAGMPANVELEYGSNIQRFDLKISGGEILVPINGDACRVQISFAKAMAI